MARNFTPMLRWFLLGGMLVIAASPNEAAAHLQDELRVGFGVTDITPDVNGGPVYLAGFGNNRKATGVHDPLFARAVVLAQGDKMIALVSVDLVGFFHANVLNVRSQLPGFHYILVASTHNHEGPDSLGLWGPTTPLPKSGIDPAYLKKVEVQIVASIRAAENQLTPCQVRIGKANAPELLHDGREPQVLHDELVVLSFHDAQGKRLGLFFPWHCHPETLSSKNTLVSADYVGYAVDALSKKHNCPATYFTGTVGGLLTSLHVPLKDNQGNELKDGTFEKTEKYGLELAKVVDRALEKSVPVKLTPLDVRSQQVFIPMENKLYHAARWMGVLRRDAFFWTGDPMKAEPAPNDSRDKPLAIRTEIAHLRLGEVDVVAFPGEVYPELVLDRIQDPIDPGADFPAAPKEPALFPQLKRPHKMLIGLANDEIGYVLPKRQWDEKAPFCYGRMKSQYGEQNSIGPEAGPILCEAFKKLAAQP